MAKPPTVQLGEIIVDGGLDPFAQNYIDSFDASVSQNWDTVPTADSNQQAFAPPEPVFMPETVVQPKPLPVPVATSTVVDAIARRFPWLLLLGSMAGGAPGTGDAPTESSSIADRYDPPKPPPTIDPVFEDFDPPNWNDLAKGGDSGMMDTIYDRLIPIPIPPVEMPDNTKFFDVSPPQPTTRPTVPDFTPWSFPDVGPDFEAQPFPTGPGPGPTSTPISTPGIDPTPGYPEPGDFPEPRRSPQPDPTSDPSPDVFSTPLPDGIGDPIGDPFVEPSRPVRTVPDPANPVRNKPGDTPQPFADPIDTPSPFDTFDPMPLPLPQPDPFTPNKDQCGCAKKKKDKKAKKKPRDVCYRGTYVELRKGLSKTRLEEVPCSDTAPKKPKSSTPRKRKKTPSWDDTLRDVFQLP